ncbi:MAG: histidine phosphatase family protein [Patescibacteria group bacterium]
MSWKAPSEVTLIRHGESLYNTLIKVKGMLKNEEMKERLRGYSDMAVPLTYDGRWQAKKSGQKIIDDIGRPDCIFHSGYLRAEQAAQGLLTHLSPAAKERIKVEHTFELRERDAGICWFMTVAETEKYLPWYQEYYDRVPQFFFRPPGGESIAEMVDKRLRNVIETVFTDCRGKKVWLVCHGQTIKGLRVLIERMNLMEIDEMCRVDVPLLSLTRYVYQCSRDVPERTHLYRIYA